MELPTSAFFKRKLAQKMMSVCHSDMSKFGRTEFRVADARAVICESDGRCENCGLEMLFDYWHPRCLHMFTFDRVRLDRPHSRENVRLLCYYCNVTVADRRDKNGDTYPIACPKIDCLNGCHAGVVRRELGVSRHRGPPPVYKRRT